MIWFILFFPQNATVEPLFVEQFGLVLLFEDFSSVNKMVRQTASLLWWLNLSVNEKELVRVCFDLLIQLFIALVQLYGDILDQLLVFCLLNTKIFDNFFVFFCLSCWIYSRRKSVSETRSFAFLDGLLDFSYVNISDFYSPFRILSNCFTCFLLSGRWLIWRSIIPTQLGDWGLSRCITQLHCL